MGYENKLPGQLLYRKFDSIFACQNRGIPWFCKKNALQNRGIPRF